MRTKRQMPGSKKALPDNLASQVSDLFPSHIKVYELARLKNGIAGSSSFLLHKHFTEPPGEETLEQLVIEIAEYLKDQDIHAVYSFFYRAGQVQSSGREWVLSCAKLNRDDKGLPKEIVTFSYDLQFLGDIKKRLYHVLENDEFFKENFTKVSSLTKREKEIIKLVTEGLNSRQIANTLHISVHTANTHRKKINEKLNTLNFAGLLRVANVFDLTTSPDK